jgi:hypothetical protein
MPGTIAFSSDSRLVALVRSPTRVHIHRTGTGEEVAAIQPLAPGYGGWMEISPDGGRLAMASPGLQAVKVWDLAAIRREIAALGLDWDDRGPEAPWHRRRRAPCAPSTGPRCPGRPSPARRTSGPGT